MDKVVNEALNKLEKEATTTLPRTSSLDEQFRTKINENIENLKKELENKDLDYPRFKDLYNTYGSDLVQSLHYILNQHFEGSGSKWAEEFEKDANNIYAIDANNIRRQLLEMVYRVTYYINETGSNQKIFDELFKGAEIQRILDICFDMDKQQSLKKMKIRGEDLNGNPFPSGWLWSYKSDWEKLKIIYKDNEDALDILKKNDYTIENAFLILFVKNTPFRENYGDYMKPEAPEWMLNRIPNFKEELDKLAKDWKEGKNNKITLTNNGTERKTRFKIGFNDYFSPSNDSLAGLLKDKFGYRVLAEELVKIITEEGDEPQSIGIYAPWGSGKSTLMNMIKEQLIIHQSAENLNRMIRKHKYFNNIQSNSFVPTNEEGLYQPFVFDEIVEVFAYMEEIHRIESVEEYIKEVAKIQLSSRISKKTVQDDGYGTYDSYQQLENKNENARNEAGDDDEISPLLPVSIAKKKSQEQGPIKDTPRSDFRTIFFDYVDWKRRWRVDAMVRNSDVAGITWKRYCCNNYCVKDDNLTLPSDLRDRIGMLVDKTNRSCWNSVKELFVSNGIRSSVICDGNEMCKCNCFCSFPYPTICRCPCYCFGPFEDLCEQCWMPAGVDFCTTCSTFTCRHAVPTQERERLGIPDIESGESVEKKSQKYLFVHFNAWVYQGADNLWTSLVYEIFDVVEGYLGEKVVRMERLNTELAGDIPDEFEGDAARAHARERLRAKYTMKILCIYFSLLLVSTVWILAGLGIQCATSSTCYLENSSNNTLSPTIHPTLVPTTEVPSFSPTRVPTYLIETKNDFIQWQQFYDQMNGKSWLYCSDNRLSPCSCNEPSNDVKIVCESLDNSNIFTGTTNWRITEIHLLNNNLIGIVPSSSLTRMSLLHKFDISNKEGTSNVDIGGNYVINPDSISDCVKLPFCYHVTTSCSILRTGQSICPATTVSPAISPTYTPTASPTTELQGQFPYGAFLPPIILVGLKLLYDLFNLIIMIRKFLSESRGQFLLNKNIESFKDKNTLGFMGEVKQELNYLWDTVRTWPYVARIRGIQPYPAEKIKLVIFIDDLDRCPSEVICNVLSAINLLLQNPKAPVICVLGIDFDIIVEALETKLKNDINGSTFLEKIISLPVSLPQPTEMDNSKFTLETTLERNGKIDYKKMFEIVRGLIKVHFEWEIGDAIKLFKQRCFLKKLMDIIKGMDLEIYFNQITRKYKFKNIGDVVNEFNNLASESMEEQQQLWHKILTIIVICITNLEEVIDDKMKEENAKIVINNIITENQHPDYSSLSDVAMTTNNSEEKKVDDQVKQEETSGPDAEAITWMMRFPEFIFKQLTVRSRKRILNIYTLSRKVIERVDRDSNDYTGTPEGRVRLLKLIVLASIYPQELRACIDSEKEFEILKGKNKNLEGWLSEYPTIKANDISSYQRYIFNLPLPSKKDKGKGNEGMNG